MYAIYNLNALLTESVVDFSWVIELYGSPELQTFSENEISRPYTNQSIKIYIEPLRSLFKVAPRRSKWSFEKIQNKTLSEETVLLF